MPVGTAASIGGTTANGSPIGNGAPARIAPGATLRLAGPDGLRKIPVEDFLLACGRQDRRPGEIVESLLIPRQEDRLRCHTVSKRFDRDISAVCGCFGIRVDGGPTASARIASGGMAATPKRARAVEAALTGRPCPEATVAAALPAFAEDFRPISDLRASWAGRLTVARNLLRRAWARGPAAPVADPPRGTGAA